MHTACAGAPCIRQVADSRGPARPIVRVIEDPGGGRLTLYGTYHVAGAADVPEAMWQALADAEVFVAEVDAAAVEPAAAFLPRGQSLMKILPADDFYALERLLDRHADALAPLKPWVAISLLAARAFAAPEPTIDEALLDRARALGKEIVFLETAAEQIAFLDRAIDGDDLRQAIHDQAEMPCVIADGLARWRAGDEGGLGATRDGATRDILVTERNRRFRVVLDGLLAARRRAFVAIGAAHVVTLYGERDHRAAAPR